MVIFDSYVKLPWGTKNCESICLRIEDASFSLFDRPTQNIGVVMNAMYIHMYVCVYVYIYNTPLNSVPDPVVWIL